MAFNFVSVLQKHNCAGIKAKRGEAVVHAFQLQAICPETAIMDPSSLPTIMHFAGIVLFLAEACFGNIALFRRCRLVPSSYVLTKKVP